MLREHSFGWVNASYIVGLQIINAHMKRALGTLTPWQAFSQALEQSNEKLQAEMA